MKREKEGLTGRHSSETWIHGFNPGCSKPDLHKQLDKHLRARATHPFFLLKVWRVAHQYCGFKAPEACRFRGWGRAGQPLNMNGGLQLRLIPYRVHHSRLPDPSMTTGHHANDITVDHLCVPGVLYVKSS